MVWDRKIWRFVIVLTRIGEDELVPKGGGLDIRQSQEYVYRTLTEKQTCAKCSRK